MPYPNEHACRLKSPKSFTRFTRGTRKSGGKTYSIIFGWKKGSDGEETSQEQAYRYSKKTWTAAEARKHCKAHDGSFEAASDEKESFGLETFLSLATEDITHDAGGFMSEKLQESLKKITVPMLELYVPDLLKGVREKAVNPVKEELDKEIESLTEERDELKGKLEKYEAQEAENKERQELLSTVTEAMKKAEIPETALTETRRTLALAALSGTEKDDRPKVLEGIVADWKVIPKEKLEEGVTSENAEQHGDKTRRAENATEESRPPNEGEPVVEDAQVLGAFGVAESKE